MAGKCEETARDYLVFLDKLLGSKRPNFLQATRTAVKVKLKWDKIQNFINNLERLQGSLTLATVLSCRHSAEGNNAEVLTHLKAIQTSQQAQISESANIEATIQLLSNAIQSQGEGSQEAIIAEIRNCLDPILRTRPDLQQPRPADLMLSGTEGEMCRWLDFRQISWRYENVDHAYNHTYEWIFEAPRSHQTWDEFSEYLESNGATRPYFIQGKAGSGKSTLMKYVLQHERTKVGLTKWAGPSCELMVVHYFFWNAGMSLQKTHTGLLRALLHAVLDKHPELIPQAFPKLYHTWKPASNDTEPEYEELKHGLTRLLEKAQFLRLAIFIDGVDEFEGDHSDMSAYLRDLVTDRVKVVVSSRPLNTCLNIFKRCPTLRLQDLTRRDMEIFIQGELTSQDDMTALRAEFPDQAERLSDAILEKAEGVFLWVKLVVRLLLEGIRNGDTFDELQFILQSLPSDLKQLYQRMLSSMNDEHQVQAAEIFQLLRTWQEIFEQQPIPALVLYHAVNNPAATHEASIPWKLEHIANRIRSRCNGLLEISFVNNPTLTEKETREAETPVVTYLHLTVAEFLSLDEVQNVTFGLTERRGYDPLQHLATACLQVMTLKPLLRTRTLKRYMLRLAGICRQATRWSIDSVFYYLCAADEAMSHLSYGKTPWHWSIAEEMTVMGQVVPCLSQFSDIRTFATEQGFCCPKAMLHPVEDINTRFAITAHALGSWVRDRDTDKLFVPSLKRRRGILAYYLETLIGPETVVFGTTIWNVATELCAQAGGALEDELELLVVLLEASRRPELLWSQTYTGGSGLRIISDLRKQIYDMRHSRVTDAIVTEKEHLLWRFEYLVRAHTFPRHPGPQQYKNTGQRSDRGRRRKKLWTRDKARITHHV